MYGIIALLAILPINATQAELAYQIEETAKNEALQDFANCELYSTSCVDPQCPYEGYGECAAYGALYTDYFLGIRPMNTTK